MGILARMQREFSESQPELMDLPNLDENALRSDLRYLERLNRTFGGRKAVETVFHKLADYADLPSRNELFLAPAVY